MSLFSRLYRKGSALLNQFAGARRQLHFQLSYPNLSMNNCTIGKGVRIYCAPNSKITLSNVQIGRNSTLIADHGGKIKIEGTFIGEHCTIVSRESIVIGEHTQIAELVVIRDQNHKFGEAGKTIAEQGFETAAIHIGKNVWLGAKSTVLMGTIIGDNSVLGAHSVASGELDADSVYVGAIAKKVKSHSS